LTTPNLQNQELSHRWPQVLPGGKHVLFTIQVGAAASYDEARIAVLSLETHQWRTVLQGGTYARYVPSGHMVYVHAGSLFALAFNLSHMEATGSPVPVQEGVVNTALTSGGAEYDVTPSGLLVYLSGNTKPAVRKLVWVDRTGLAKPLPAPAMVYTAPALSPDGKLLAVQIIEEGNSGIWIYEFARNTLTRLTFGPGSSSAPLWTPDGRSVIYNTRTETPSFRSKLADGSGKENLLFAKEFQALGAAPQSVSPDGKALLFTAYGSAGTMTIKTLSLDGSDNIQRFLQAPFTLNSAHFSPDGHWVADTTDESGRRDICVQPFPAGNGKWMISTAGGQYPRWPRNAHEIFFISGDQLMSVAVKTQPAFKPGTPHALFSTTDYLVGAGNYDVTPNGQQFLMVKQEELSTSPKELNVVLNWPEELKQRVPAGDK
jgi:WD40-like Beta Propeller Repeat